MIQLEFEIGEIYVENKKRELCQHGHRVIDIDMDHECDHDSDTDSEMPLPELEAAVIASPVAAGVPADRDDDLESKIDSFLSGRRRTNAVPPSPDEDWEDDDSVPMPRHGAGARDGEGADPAERRSLDGADDPSADEPPAASATPPAATSSSAASAAVPQRRRRQRPPPAPRGGRPAGRTPTTPRKTRQRREATAEAAQRRTRGGARRAATEETRRRADAGPRATGAREREATAPRAGNGVGVLGWYAATETGAVATGGSRDDGAMPSSSKMPPAGELSQGGEARMLGCDEDASGAGAKDNSDWHQHAKRLHQYAAEYQRLPRPSAGENFPKEAKLGAWAKEQSSKCGGEGCPRTRSSGSNKSTRCWRPRRPRRRRRRSGGKSE